MIWEGLVQEGLAVTRMIHDRYHARKRNPWNEVECSDHYARAMASYDVFVAACGYAYHGPKGHLGFAPRLTPEDFRAAFTSAESWGTFEQKRDTASQRETIALRYGRLTLRTLAFEVAAGFQPRSVSVSAHGQALSARMEQHGNRITVILQPGHTLTAPDRLEVSLLA